MNDRLRQQRNNVRRIKEATGRVESQPYDFAGMLRAPNFPGQLALAQTTSTIPGRSGSTLKSGTVTFQKFDGTTQSATGLTNVKVYNFASNDIPAGKNCVVASLGGYWFVISYEC